MGSITGWGLRFGSSRKETNDLTFKLIRYKVIPKVKILLSRGQQENKFHVQVQNAEVISLELT